MEIGGVRLALLFAVIQDLVRTFYFYDQKTSIRGSSGILPRFDGHSWSGAYTGDTPVLFEVCEYIDDDLKRLFDSAPRTDIPYRNDT